MCPCPCGSDRNFDECCGPVLTGRPALTAEALMRSRYTAYVQGNLDHIESTNAAEVGSAFDRARAEESARGIEWLGLDVIETIAGGADDDSGSVEFRARFSRLGQDLIHHEAATFHREDGRWVYAEGRVNSRPVSRRVTHVGRNDPCPCASGKKFKKCCGA